MGDEEIASRGRSGGDEVPVDGRTPHVAGQVDGSEERRLTPCVFEARGAGSGAPGEAT